LHILTTRAVFDSLSQRRNKLNYFIFTEVTDYFLAGNDQPQINQPNFVKYS